MKHRVLSMAITFAAAILAPRPSFAADPSGLEQQVRKGHPLVIHVTVPLCSNAQIDCGSNVAGNPGRLDTNLYWGAAFGHRHYFDRKKSGFVRIAISKGDEPVLERAMYRRHVSALPFGGREGEMVELLLVLEAYHGDSIDKAVISFYQRATSGGVIRFRDGDIEREERISVAGYAGHNRLMDGTKLPSGRRSGEGRAIPSFVLACYSDSSFAGALREAGSVPLLMTRSLMAPEGYVLEAVVSALAVNAPRARIRERAVAAYAKWQKLSIPAAGTIFSPPSP